LPVPFLATLTFEAPRPKPLVTGVRSYDGRRRQDGVRESIVD
jgi:hypothetical protein